MTPTATAAATAATPAETDLARADPDAALYRKISWRIMPLLILAYIVSYLDRINIGYAQLQMKDALGFSPAAFGVGAGIMFLGYCLFEIPSNLLLERIGARKTFLRIMVLWGLTASATALVATPTQFYVLRFCLGVFEAGFFPGVILYLTYWYPTARRGRMVAVFSTAPVIAGILAGPLCGATLKYLDQVAGLAGWQWVYLSQGLPAVLLGGVLYTVLQDRPAPSHWLAADEAARLQHNLAAQPGGARHASLAQLRQVLAMPRVWALALVSFLTLGGQYTMVFWIPTLIKSWGVADPLQIGLYSAIPSLLGAVTMVLVGRHSDRRLERRWHFAASCALSALGLFITTLTQGQLLPSLAAMCVMVMGMASATPLLTTAQADDLPRALAAPGIAFITSCGILGAAASPAVTGLLNARTGSELYSLYLVMALFIIAPALLLAILPARPRTPRAD